jgi:hypothetical protein
LFSLNAASVLIVGLLFKYSEFLKKWFVQNEDAAKKPDQTCPVIITADISPDQLSNFVLRSWVEFQDPNIAVRQCATHKASNTDGIDGILRCHISGTVYYPNRDGHIFAMANLDSLPTGRYETFKGVVNFTFKCLSSDFSQQTKDNPVIVSRESPLKLIIALDDVM